MDTNNIVVTAADTTYFGRLEGLVQSVQANSPKTPIWVYDIGLFEDEKAKLKRNYGIETRRIPAINPYILKPLPYNTLPNCRKIVGLYSWKPVAMMDAIFYKRNVLWLDAGTSVIGDLTPIFEHIENVGCFLIGIHNIHYMATDTVINHYGLTPEFLELQGTNAGIQGVNERYMLNYLMDAYIAAHDIELFKDNGTAGGGAGAGRHDQAIFSILARKYNMPFFENGHFIDLQTNDGIKKVSIPYQRHEIKADTIIYHCRGDHNYWKNLKK